VSQREVIIRQIQHEMKASNGDKMALELLQEEHRRLQESWKAKVFEMGKLQLPTGKLERLMNISNKFLGRKFEDLKSLITRSINILYTN